MKNVFDYRAYFFDFDGVIADTNGVKASAFADIYRPYGEEIVDKVVAHHLAHGGMSRYEKFRHYHLSFLNKELTDSETRFLAEEFARKIFDRVAAAPFIAGAVDFIEKLFAADKPMFIVSGTPDEEIKKIIILKGLSKSFRAVGGSPKTKREIINQSCAGLEVEYSDCVLFGDAEEDLAAAVGMGLDFVPINFYDGRGGYKNFKELVSAANNF